MRAFCLSIYGLRSLCRNERIRRIPNLFLQLEAFLEGFADAIGHFIVAMEVITASKEFCDCEFS